MDFFPCLALALFLIPKVKDRLSMIKITEAQLLAQDALKAESALEVRNLIRNHFKEPLFKEFTPDKVVST